jgi:two-component system sensor histidine kinase/response regulator
MDKAPCEGIANDAAHKKCRKQREMLIMYKRFFDECPIGLYKTRNKDGLFLDINQTGAEMLGYDSPEEVIGKVYSTELYDPTLRKEIVKQIAKEGKVVDFEAEFCRKDGSCIWVSISATNGNDEIIGSIQDISTRKELENEIEELKDQMVIPLQQVEQAAKQRLELFETSIAEFERRELHG